MMPRQHIGFGSSWRYRCKRKCVDVQNMLEMVGCSRLPGSHGLVAWKRVTIRTRCKHEHLIHHTTFVHGRRLGGYTFQGIILERFEFVEEVVVLVTVVEV